MDTPKKKTPKPEIQHQDQIGQAIRPGQVVAFCWSGAPGIKIGTVQRLTRQRVRIAYKWTWTHHTTGETRVNEWTYLSTPQRTLVLGDGLGAELTMLKLRGLLP